MNMGQIAAFGMSIIAFIGSIVSLVWAFSKRPTYDYCDETYQRKDLHIQEYNTLIAMIRELKASVDALKKND